MVRKIVTFIVVVSFVAACGRGPRNIPVAVDGDQQMSCQQINVEMVKTRDEIRQMLVELQEIDAKNTGLVVASWFTIFMTMPFVDIRQGQYADLKALRERHHYLDKIRIARKCDFATIPLEKYEQQVLDQNFEKLRQTYPGK